MIITFRKHRYTLGSVFAYCWEYELVQGAKFGAFVAALALLCYAICLSRGSSTAALFGAIFASFVVLEILDYAFIHTSMAFRADHWRWHTRREVFNALVFTGLLAGAAAALSFSAVDSMDARGMIWKAAKLKKSVGLFIDARMGAEVLRLYSLRPTDLDAGEFFEANLYSS